MIPAGKMVFMNKTKDTEIIKQVYNPNGIGKEINLSEADIQTLNKEEITSKGYKLNEKTKAFSFEVDCPKRHGIKKFEAIPKDGGTLDGEYFESIDKLIACPQMEEVKKYVMLR